MNTNRTNSLKIPKIIENSFESNINIDDKFAIYEAIATANNEKIDKDYLNTFNYDNEEVNIVQKIPSNSNDLVVITYAKKLCAYIITITEKSPAKYRGVFVNRMQNLSLEILELLLQANFVRIDSLDNKKKREEYQKDAIIKLKMLGYIAMVAGNSKCILPKQFKQISIQIGESINLIVAWKKAMIIDGVIVQIIKGF